MSLLGEGTKKRDGEIDRGKGEERERVVAARKHVPLTRQTFCSRSSTDTSLPRIPKCFRVFLGISFFLEEEKKKRKEKKRRSFRSVKEHSVTRDSMCSQKTSIGIAAEYTPSDAWSSQSYFYARFACLNELSSLLCNLHTSLRRIF